MNLQLKEQKTLILALENEITQHKTERIQLL